MADIKEKVEKVKKERDWEWGEFLLGKLTSRKFLLSLVPIVTGILMIFGLESSTASQIAGAVMALVSTVAYIIMEGKIDVETAKKVMYDVDEIIDAIDKREAEIGSENGIETCEND